MLAPAKNKEIAIAAIDSGADAVYIGASQFGARQNAINSIEDIKDVVDYAHKFWVKVFVTVNTVLKDDEILQAVELVKELDKIGVDAILIQDMGLLKKLVELHLPIPIHASTQCDNRDIEKIKFFRDIGLSRVVLARELSLEQIKNIHTEVPEIELESFIHGALCVSYSGQCYLSAYIGNRSANRGECAQPCRKKYTILDENSNIIAKDIYALCLKDFNASKNIKKMIENGIYSFKIEGRLKDINYVKNIVSFYRQLLDKYSTKSSSGKTFLKFIPDPEKSFNRGFTDYFQQKRTDCFNFISPKSIGKYIGEYISNKNKDCIFIRTDADISAQDGLCYIKDNVLEGFSVNKSEKTNGGYLIYPNKKIELDNKTKIYRNLDVKFEKELSEKVKRQIGIDVIVKDSIITITDENNITVSQNIEEKEPAKNQEKMNETFIKQFSKTGDSDFYINNIQILSDVPFMPVSTINKIRRELLEQLMRERIIKYKRNIQKSLRYAPFYKKELDYRANINNAEAKQFYEKCDCVIKEPGFESKIPDRQVELMRTKHCIKFALNMCKSPRNLFLKDEKGVIYPLRFECDNCEMTVLSP